MTSRLVVIPTRRAHSNHAEVARSIGVDIIAGRCAEGTRLPGDAVAPLGDMGAPGDDVALPVGAAPIQPDARRDIMPA